MLLSRDILTASVLTRLMAVSIQQNLITEPITRLLECVCYGKCVIYRLSSRHLPRGLAPRVAILHVLLTKSSTMGPDRGSALFTLTLTQRLICGL